MSIARTTLILRYRPSRWAESSTPIAATGRLYLVLSRTACWFLLEAFPVAKPANPVRLALPLFPSPSFPPLCRRTSGRRYPLSLSSPPSPFVLFLCAQHVFHRDTGKARRKYQSPHPSWENLANCNVSVTRNPRCSGDLINGVNGSGAELRYRAHSCYSRTIANRFRRTRRRDAQFRTGDERPPRHNANHKLPLYFDRCVLNAVAIVCFRSRDCCRTGPRRTEGQFYR